MPYNPFVLLFSSLTPTIHEVCWPPKLRGIEGGWGDGASDSAIPSSITILERSPTSPADWAGDLPTPGEGMEGGGELRVLLVLF